MKIKELARQKHKRFCTCEGSEFIASEFSLMKILQMIKIFEVKSVLEVGVGIGTIADTVLEYSNSVAKPLAYCGTESNPFCLQAIPQNTSHFPKLSLYRTLSEVPRNIKFDLLIIDGQDEALKNILSLCSPQAIIFIEGDRMPQMQLLLKMFPRGKYVNVTSNKKNPIYAPGGSGRYVGGGRVIFTNPDIFMTLYWIKEKVKTHFLRYFRRYDKSLMV